MSANVKRDKPATLEMVSHHCRVGLAEVLPDGRTRHPLCPGSGGNGIGSTWFCSCQCHIDVPVCRDCRRIDVELTLDGTCIDLEGCEGAIARKQEQNPIWRQLQDLKADSVRRDEQKAAERAQARQAARELAARQAESEGRVAPVRTVRTPKPAPTPQRCHCGCGGMTKGGRFVAGHDAKLKGVLVKMARRSPTTVPGVVRQASESDAVRATAELIARDWPRKGVLDKTTAKAEDLINQHGVDRIVELAVARRYGDGK